MKPSKSMSPTRHIGPGGRWQYDLVSGNLDRVQQMLLSRTIRILLSAFLLAILVALAANKLFYDSSIAATFYPYVFASVIFIHLRLAFRLKDVAGTLLCGVLFILLDVFIFHPHSVYLTSCVSFLGMGSLAVMSLRAVWSEKRERSRILLALVPGALILASNFFAAFIHLWTENAHPKVLDLYLYSFDSSLRVPIVFWLGQAFAKWSALRAIGMIFYVALPFSVAIVYSGQAVRLRGRAIPVLAAFLLAGPLGGLFYNMFPALGPSHLFGEGFPWSPLPTERARTLFLEPVAIAGLRNAIPSLHMGWTLLAWWYSQGLSLWERGIAFAFVAFTVCATMGTGEHYFIDLVVAVPFVLFIQALCTISLDWKDSGRWLPFLFGLAATLGWLTVLRFGVRVFWYSPVIPWLSCVATIGLCELTRRGLRDPAVGMAGAHKTITFETADAVMETVP
jgi:hypothetical protein